MPSPDAAPVRSFETITTLSLVSDGFVLVDESFRTVALDAGAEAIFSLFGRQNGCGEVRVPSRIIEVLRARGQDDDGSPISLSAGGHHYSCRAFSVRFPDGAARMLALYLKREMSVVDAVHHIASEYRLTDREKETLLGLSMGLTSKELAVKMKISPNTVKAFVRLAMIKMGANSRAGIFAKLLDRQSG